jgi:dTDP-4-amino-4,6-dideoxygalactose transaminase
MRRYNYSRLAQALQDFGEVDWFPQLGHGICPYVFPLRIRGGCRSSVHALRSSGIPVSSWPDLPPEVVSEPRFQAEAIRACDEIMLVPVHQSLAPRHVDRIARTLISLMGRAAVDAGHVPALVSSTEVSHDKTY